MPFESRVYCHKITFDIPDQDFDNLLAYEGAKFREFDLPVLSTMLDYIDDVSGTNYSGHFGRQVFADFEVDENGETPQVEQFQALLDDFFIDARRAVAIIPEVFRFGGRHDVEMVALYDSGTRSGRVYRTLVYGDDDFLIATGKAGIYSIFHREGGELQRVDAEMPRALRIKIDHDREVRSDHRMSRRQITMSKDIKGVREWVSTLVPLDIKVPTVDVTGHFLAEQLPEGARPVLKHRSFIVADHGRDVGLSITFQSEGEFGTKWFVDGKREQLLKNIDVDGGMNGNLNDRILRQLPNDVAMPGIRIPRP